MDSIRIKNLRSIVDSGVIELSRINILLGKNSSGKSSFLRLFPLLKETSRHELRGPILWFDEDYDFGDFSNTLSRHAQGDKNTISIEFSWTQNYRSHRGYYTFYDVEENDNSKRETITVEIGISKYGDKNYFKRIRVSNKDNAFLLENENPNKPVRLFVDGKEIHNGAFRWNYGSTGILPQLRPQDDFSFFDTINNSLQVIYDDKSIRFDAYYTIMNLDSLKEDSIWKIVKEHSSKGKDKKLIHNYRKTDDYRKIIDTIIWLFLSRYIGFIDEQLSSYFNRTYYVTPLRYNFQRYMRNRDLAVEYVESTGKNVMEYILSLSESERTSYIDYIKKTLEIEIDVEGQDNKSIYVTMKDGERDNIVDVGYGYSQVLPVATILWDRAYKKDQRSNEATIVIEQPEVHLHPAMQKKLARLFVEAQSLAKSRKQKLTLIIETHSSSLINRLGRYVQNSSSQIIPELSSYYKMDEESEVKLSNNDIAVYLFDKKDGVTQITKANYDRNGHIERWPIGFLD